MINFQKKMIQKKIKNWESDKQLLIAREKIRKQKEQIFKDRKQKKKQITTTKRLMFFLFLSCSAIQVFTMYVTLRSMELGLGPDFGPLQMLISAIVAEVIGFAIYSVKALKQNTKGGIIYDSAMYDRLLDNQESEEALG